MQNWQRRRNCEMGRFSRLQNCLFLPKWKLCKGRLFFFFNMDLFFDTQSVQSSLEEKMEHFSKMDEREQARMEKGREKMTERERERD
jgi:hypothetical protein